MGRLTPVQTRLRGTAAPATEEEARKLLERLQVMRAWKLSEVLSLDEATGQKLFKALGEHDARIFDAQRKLRGAERGLVEALKAKYI